MHCQYHLFWTLTMDVSWYCKPSSFRLAFCIMPIFSLCISLFVLNKCNNYLRLRKVSNKIPFYHRILCSLFNERFTPIKILIDFLFCATELVDTVWNIVFQRWFDKMWSAKFAASTDVRSITKSPEYGILVCANFCCFIRLIRLLQWLRNRKVLYTNFCCFMIAV